MKIVNDKSLVLIQSRFSSKRLPGKALFPIEGIPIVVLAALRAANTGKDVLVLTSSDSSDNEICRALEVYGIQYFRGSLNNVLDRFYQALKDELNEKIIIRLTADNVLPDGSFLDEIEEQFDSLNVDIVNCNSNKSNLPYGVSAEVMRVSSLRKAYENSRDDYDREHVTPYIYRNGKSQPFLSKSFRGYNNFRVTIDTYDDYISVKSLFEGVEDVTKVPMHALMHNFSRMKYRPFYEKSLKPMTLGTVQLGMNYGITNTNAQVKQSEAKEIIKQAITEGIEYIDTAAVYGNSEEVIGLSLEGGWRDRVKLITKIPPLSSTNHLDEKHLPLLVRSSFYESCLRLNTRKLDVLMFHRFDDSLIPSVLNEVKNIKSSGGIAEIGVSVQSPEELRAVLDDETFTLVQLPFNIFDYRWDALVETVLTVKNKRKLVIHARSALLQGLLCSKDSAKWMRAGVKNYQEIIDWLESGFKKYEKMSVSDLCIGYVNSQRWIDSVVVGIDSLSNLYSNLQSISMPLMSDACLDDIVRSRPKLSSESLNPALWS